MNEILTGCTDRVKSVLSFDRLFRLSSVIQYVTGGILIVAAIIRFAYIMSIETFAGITLTVYVLIFALILILTEASVLECRSYFYFLNFGWGKGLANIFIACIMLGAGAAVPWLDIITSIYLIVLAVLLPLVTILYRSIEHDWVD